MEKEKIIINADDYLEIIKKQIDIYSQIQSNSIRSLRFFVALLGAIVGLLSLAIGYGILDTIINYFQTIDIARIIAEGAEEYGVPESRISFSIYILIMISILSLMCIPFFFVLAVVSVLGALSAPELRPSFGGKQIKIQVEEYSSSRNAGGIFSQLIDISQTFIKSQGSISEKTISVIDKVASESAKRSSKRTQQKDVIADWIEWNNQVIYNLSNQLNNSYKFLVGSIFSAMVSILSVLSLVSINIYLVLLLFLAGTIGATIGLLLRGIAWLSLMIRGERNKTNIRST